MNVTISSSLSCIFHMSLIFDHRPVFLRPKPLNFLFFTFDIYNINYFFHHKRCVEGTAELKKYTYIFRVSPEKLPSQQKMLSFSIFFILLKNQFQACTRITIAVSQNCHCKLQQKLKLLAYSEFKIGNHRYSKACAGICKQSTGARNRVGIGLSYRPVRLKSPKKLTHWNRFLYSLKV
jgi:hypothetical protein